jgi:Peptidase family M1 domain
MLNHSTNHSLVILLCLLALVVGASPVSAGLAEEAAAIDSPSVAGEVHFGASILVGHGEIIPSVGTKVLLLRAGGEPCGVLVDGPARFTYTVDNPYSIPVAERNLKHITNMRLGIVRNHVVVGENLDSAVVWGWNVAAGDAGAAGKDGRKVPEWAREILDGSYFAPPSHGLIEERRLGSGGVRVALLHGQPEDLLIDVDPVEGRLEVLAKVERQGDVLAADHGRHWLQELAAQPLGRHWSTRFPAPLVAVKETLEVDNDHDEHVTIRSTSTLQSTRPGVGLWRTDLLDRWYGHRRENPLTVSSVKVNGKSADFLQQSNELLVEVGSPLARGGGATVSVVGSGDIAIRPGSDNYWALGALPWHPLALNGEFATIDLKVRVPEPLVPFASGQVVSRETKDGYTTLRTRLDIPSQLPVVAAGKYHVYSETKDGIRCNAASYAFGNEKACRRLIGNFFAASEFYSSLFGVPFPYKKLSVVEINTWGFGQAPAGVIFITKEAYQPLIAYENQFFSAGVNERFVHEVAHAWWGHTVMMDSSEEQWLTESFAEYSAALFLEAARGGGKKGRKQFGELLRGWRARTKLVGDGGSIYLANHLAIKNTRDLEDRTNLLYSKGPLVLQAIRLELRKRAGNDEEGDRLFQSLLRSYLKNFTYKWGTTENFIGLLDQLTKSDWHPFFDRYVFGTEIPDV